MEYLNPQISNNVFLFVGIFVFSIASGAAIYVAKKYIDKVFESAKQKDETFSELISKVDRLVGRVAEIIKDLKIHDDKLQSHAELDEEFRTSFERSLVYKLDTMRGEIIHTENVGKARHESLKGKIGSQTTRIEKQAEQISTLERTLDALIISHQFKHPEAVLPVKK